MDTLIGVLIVLFAFRIRHTICGSGSRMPNPLIQHGSPEEEAWRWKLLPLYIRHMRSRETYFFKAKYYDKPEGEDLLGKLIATNRMVFPYAFTCGMMDACMYTRKEGLQARAGRLLHFIWPAVGVATAFTTTAYFGAKIRGTDDLYVARSKL